MKGNDFVALRLALTAEILACHLDRAFHGFGSGIGEKDLVRKSGLGQPGRQFFLIGDVVKVRRVPESLSLINENSAQFRVGVPEGIDGDP